ncbi:MAG: hypothetical protein AB1796_08420 [Bacillota bacterium]
MPYYQQDQYYCIDMLFSLAVAGRWYCKAEDDDGKVRLIRTGRMESFLGLKTRMNSMFFYSIQVGMNSHEDGG